MQWQGFVGGPGYSVFHFRDFSTPADTEPNSQDAADRVDKFATDLKPLLPPAINLQTDPTVDILEDTTGQLLGSHTAVVQAPHVGTSTGTNYASALGMIINWRTNDVRNGKRVRGRTFLVPVASANFDATGTLQPSGIITVAATAATNMLDAALKSCDLAIYSRPGKGLSNGQAYPATTYTVPDMGAVLRSRRD
jgi:hypothetical protein